MSEKITIVIPTHNRVKYLKRILNYYKDTEYKIFVADSSKEEFQEKDMFKINYFHYPRFPFLKKMCDIINKVKTPYVLICADDDFIIPQSIQKCIIFLDAHNDYSSVQGLYTCFLDKGKKTSFKFTHQYIINYDVNADTPEERLKQNMSLYIHLFYAVHKTENLQDTFSILINNLKNFNLIEISLAMVAVINGKHKVLPIFYSSREVMLRSLKSQTPTIRELAYNPDLQKEYRKFIEILANYLSFRYNYPNNLSKQYIIDAIDCYINISVPLLKGNSKLKLKKKKKKKKKKKIFFNFILDAVYPKIIDLKNPQTIPFTIKNNNSKSALDFKKIFNHIIEYTNKISYSKLIKIRLIKLINKIPIKFLKENIK